MPIEPRLLGMVILSGISALLFGFGSTEASAGLVASPWDKLAHIGVFALLAVALRLALPRVPLTVIIGIGLSVAVADELNQLWVPGRDPSWEDGVADMAGIALGLLVRPLLTRHLARNPAWRA
jgi:VanZ family protein